MFSPFRLSTKTHSIASCCRRRSSRTSRSSPPTPSLNVTPVRCGRSDTTISPPMTDISFGTDGWRAVIADSFTFDNVRRVSAAIAVAARGLEPPPGIDRNALAVGFDRRFLSREFAQVVAETLRIAGYRVVLSNAPTPSQTISFTAHHRKLLGGVVVTASHNPAKYNGLKFKAWYGGSALPGAGGALAAALGQTPARGGGSVSEEDFLDDYVSALRARVGDVGDLAILHDAI